VVAIHRENMVTSGNLKVIRENVLFLWSIVMCNVMDRNSETRVHAIECSVMSIRV